MRHYHGLPITPDTVAIEVARAGSLFLSHAYQQQVSDFPFTDAPMQFAEELAAAHSNKVASKAFVDFYVGVYSEHRGRPDGVVQFTHSNCRNCGAPHEPLRCSYCGTIK